MSSEDAEDLLMAHLLPFHRRMVEELINEDGLCILSAGMGWQKVVESHLLFGRRCHTQIQTESIKSAVQV